MKKKLLALILIGVMTVESTVGVSAAEAETTTKSVTLSLDVAEEYEVTIPEASTITASTESSTTKLDTEIDASVSGNLYETTRIKITAPESITLTDSISGSDRKIVMDVTAPEEEFAPEDALANTTRTWKASATVDTLKAGKYRGTINFNVEREVVKAPGLYNADGVMTVSWDELVNTKKI